MIYAIQNNKVNRAIYKANEDALTSSIFERLMYLPKEMVQYIFKEALIDVVNHLELDTIESITYWPNWNPEETLNKNRVEPDVFIRTKQTDIIIEAKRYDKNQQCPQQWNNEIQAYYNEYQEDNKSLLFIALGGLHTTTTETITVNSKEHKIYKCTWQAILNIIQELVHQIELSSNYNNSNQAITNILMDIILCFQLFGFSTAPWLERFMPAPNISKTSISYFSHSWTN